jgi:hypothetical protein
MQKMDVWIPPISIKDIDGYDVNTKEKGPQGNRATYYHLRDLVLEFKRKYHTKL